MIRLEVTLSTRILNQFQTTCSPVAARVIFGVHNNQIPGHLQEKEEIVTHPPSNWTTYLSGDSTFSRLPVVLFLSVDMPDMPQLEEDGEMNSTNTQDA